MQQQFLEAGTLMLAGMVFVFAFLSLLILFINMVLERLSIWFPDPVVARPSPSSKKTNNKKVTNGDISPAIVAAISGAVSKYRATHGNAQSSSQNSLPQNKN